MHVIAAAALWDIGTHQHSCVLRRLRKKLAALRSLSSVSWVSDASGSALAVNVVLVLQLLGLALEACLLGLRERAPRGTKLAGDLHEASCD